VRVLKPGGVDWLYLIENPRALYWDSIEILRVIMRDESKGYARESLHQIGVPPNRASYIRYHIAALRA
jgi:hypothetical protein